MTSWSLGFQVSPALSDICEEDTQDRKGLMKEVIKVCIRAI